ncbi:hypothetical protein GCK32_019074 [Trichostrongylus colubriformis]|uniref:Receptor ligand binding region domain-containing protein n=1 Tax=Trichostrongylus colubriformis TaxID=6319 RepID=A0AAN8ERV4_TRICO
MMILCLLITAFSFASGRVLNIGLMFVDGIPSMDITVGYKTSASAVLIARDRIISEGLLPGYDFNFTFRFDQCIEVLAAGITVELIRDYNADAIIGPTCSDRELFLMEAEVNQKSSFIALADPEKHRNSDAGLPRSTIEL